MSLSEPVVIQPDPTKKGLAAIEEIVAHDTISDHEKYNVATKGVMSINLEGHVSVTLDDEVTRDLKDHHIAVIVYHGRKEWVFTSPSSEETRIYSETPLQDIVVVKRTDVPTSRYFSLRDWKEWMATKVHEV